MKPAPGSVAIETKGWWLTHRWLLLRRLSQFGFLGLFLLGPWAGVWIVKGTLASSLTLGALPLTDPYIVVQSLAALHLPVRDALIGAAIVLVVYLLVGGRVYCSWVCPVNIVTDGAHWLRRRLGIMQSLRLSRNTRYGLLAATLVAALATGAISWELLNPVTLLYRELLFGVGLGSLAIAALFLFDLLIARHGWCGHLCPVGAFYGLLGRVSPVRVVAKRRRECNDCMDCYAVCPEQQVITPALKGEARGLGPVILDGACNNCGRCIDVCSRKVFEFGTRFRNKEAVT